MTADAPEAVYSPFARFQFLATRPKAWIAASGTGFVCYGLLKSSFGPTWPDSDALVAVITGMAELLVSMFTFQFYMEQGRRTPYGRAARGKTFLEWRFRVGLLVFGVLFLGFLFLHSRYVMTFKGGSTETKGIYYTDVFAKEKAQKEAEERITYTDEQAVFNHGGNVKEVYTADSVALMRWVVLLAWLALDASFAYTLTAFYILRWKELPSETSFRKKEKRV